MNQRIRANKYAVDNLVAFQTLWYIREHTPERSHTNVNIVIKLSHQEATKWTICEDIQVKSNTSATMKVAMKASFATIN